MYDVENIVMLVCSNMRGKQIQTQPVAIWEFNEARKKKQEWRMNKEIVKGIKYEMCMAYRFSKIYHSN